MVDNALLVALGGRGRSCKLKRSDCRTQSLRKTEALRRPRRIVMRSDPEAKGSASLRKKRSMRPRGWSLFGLSRHAMAGLPSCQGLEPGISPGTG